MKTRTRLAISLLDGAMDTEYVSLEEAQKEIHDNEIKMKQQAYDILKVVREQLEQAKQEAESFKKQLGYVIEDRENLTNQIAEANDIAMGYKEQINNANKILSIEWKDGDMPEYCVQRLRTILIPRKEESEK